MKTSEDRYRELKQLYSKEIDYDSFERGDKIEKMVNSLVGEIAGPHLQVFNEKIGKYVFDGCIKIGGGRSIYYEIYSANLSAFRYKRLLELVNSLFVPKRTYFLIIARSFTNKDKERIEKITNRILTSKIRLGFIDFENLISLHRFSVYMQTRTSEKQLKRLNKLFLEQLFEYRIISERVFEEALTSAREQLSGFMVARAKMAEGRLTFEQYMQAITGAYRSPIGALDVVTATHDYVRRTCDLLNEPVYNFSDISSADIPEEAGVYIIYDKELRKPIYIGTTRNLRRRLLRDHRSGNIRGSQFRKALGERSASKSETEITNYVLRKCSFQFIVVKDSQEMIRLEHFATAILAPILNVENR